MSFPTGEEQHKRQETEANAFAIELLAPADSVRPYLRRLPDLEHPLTIKETLKISKAAAVRRYAALHTRKVAVIFTKDGRFGYIERSESFPYLGIERDEPLPPLPASSSNRGLSDMIEVNPSAWRLHDVRGELACQALYQNGGRAIVLLYLDDA